jgi:cell division GTPase FtsZ
MAATDPNRLRYSASIRVIGLGDGARETLDRIRPQAAAGIDWIVADADAEDAGALGEGTDILVLTAGDCSRGVPAAPLIGTQASERGALVAGVVVGFDALAATGASDCLADLREAVDVLLLVGDDSAFVSYLEALGGIP